MAGKVYQISEESLFNIAEAIRIKSGTDTKYGVKEMPSAILDIAGGGAYIQDGEDRIYLKNEYSGKEITITENQIIDLREWIKKNELPLDITIDTFVPSGGLEITNNGNYDVYAYANVAVNVPIPEGYLKPEGTLNITENGKYNVNEYAEVSTDIKGIDTTDATATSNDLLKGKTAYVNDQKVEGTIETYNYSIDNGVKKENSLKKLLDATKNSQYLFSKYRGSNIDELIQYNDTENVTNMSYMFYKSDITSTPNININKLMIAEYMFAECKNLINFNLDTHNIDTFTNFLYKCQSLKNIKLNTNNGMNFTNMFALCYNLEKIDISYFSTYTDNTFYTQGVFNNCYSVKKIIIRSFGDYFSIDTATFKNCYHILGTVNATYNPEGLKDGYIYVPDTLLEDYKAATNWSVFADRFKPLSELEVE